MLMRRLFFIIALAGFGLAQLAPVRADQTVRKIGFLSVFSERHSGSRVWLRAFRQGLQDRGWVIGGNLQLVTRWVGGRSECRFSERRVCVPKLVDELLAEKVELIVVHGGQPALTASKRGKTVPVVMAGVSDAVGRGIIESLARPGGNVTGVTSRNPVLAAKRLELLKEVVPGLSRVGVLWTPKTWASRYAWDQIQEPARKLGLALHSIEIRRPADLETAFADAAGKGVQAVISTSGISGFKITELVGRLRRSKLPSVFPSEAHVRAGGLLSYNKDHEHLYYRAAAYVDRILKGAKPRDLPVQQPTRFDLVVNLKAARALDIAIPPAILLRANKVIE